MIYLCENMYIIIWILIGMNVGWKLDFIIEEEFNFVVLDFIKCGNLWFNKGIEFGNFIFVVVILE